MHFEDCGIFCPVVAYRLEGRFPSKRLEVL
jgi:hypothetical protein